MYLSKYFINIFIHLLIFIVTLILTVAEFELVSSFEFYSNLFFLVLSGSIIAVITETYKPKLYQKKVKYIIAPYIKFALLFWLINLLFVEIFISNQIIAQKVISLITFYSILLLVIYFILFLIIKKSKIEIHQINLESTKKYEQSNLNIDPKFNIGLVDETLVSKLVVINYPALSPLLSFQDKKSIAKTSVISDDNINETLCDKFEICIVDKKLNEFKDINHLFNNIYNNLVDGGYSILAYEELEVFENRIVYRTYNIFNFLKNLYYYFRYRALPKIPFLMKVNNLFTGGKRSAISKAEILGRLVFSGFEIIGERVSDEINIVLARKTLEQSKNPNPSFYPIITLDRVGLYGEIIKIHKVRSMHPYSEFLQKKIFESNNLNSIGKFGEDFRITKLGKYYRKYWLDELPQIYDWLRGEIKLVGIRALSQHFFSLYPREFQNLFVQVKPGIISPIFDENTDGFEDIVRIEKRYLELYLKNPIKTDIKYFFITLKQIISGVRSN